MTIAIESPYLVNDEGQFALASAKTLDKTFPSKKAAKKALKVVHESLFELHSTLIAEKKQGLLVVFQAMDAAGKDSTIREVFRGMNPLGLSIHSFQKPSKTELAHDYLWRLQQRLPQRGQIGVFNRSHYEETLIVRVFPELLQHQNLPRQRPLETEMNLRYQSIRDFERHLYENGFPVIKFFLNVGLDAQKYRLMRRINDPERHWKHDSGDMKMRSKWSAFQGAYEKVLNETSRPWAPWYCIPADNKGAMRFAVAEILNQTLLKLAPQLPEISEDDRLQLNSCRQQLLEGP